MAQDSSHPNCQNKDDSLTDTDKVAATSSPPPSPRAVTQHVSTSGVITPEEQSFTLASTDKQSDDHLEFPEDPPAEGRVNVPVRSRNQPAVQPVASSFTPSDQVVDVGYNLDQLDKGQVDSMSESLFATTSPPVLDIPLGMEGMMDEIVGLIDQMPLEDEQDEPQSEYFFPAARMQPPSGSEYNPLARPTSRWKCRWKAFAPPEEPTYSAMPVPGLVPRSSPRGQRDFKNPYIKALNHTREELDKSWSLFITEESSATRMATEREGALSTMQVLEVDYNRDLDYDVVSRLSCMPPEPCGEACRNRDFNTDYPVELCESQQCEHQLFDYKCQGMMQIEADMHRAGESNEVLMAPVSELRRKREDV